MVLCQERKENRHGAGLLTTRQLQGRAKTWHNIAINFNCWTGFGSQMARMGKKRILAFKREGDGNKRALGYCHNSARVYSSKFLILNSIKTTEINRELRVNKIDTKKAIKERKKGINALKYAKKYGNYGNMTHQTVIYAQQRGIRIKTAPDLPNLSEFLYALRDMGKIEV